jgi:ribosomal silencing factor RsfS
VEARESDDWMLVDCGNIIVSVMDAEAREVFDLERFWEGMELGKIQLGYVPKILEALKK